MKDVRDQATVTAWAVCPQCEWRVTGTGDEDPPGFVVRAAQQHTAYTEHATTTCTETTTTHAHTGTRGVTA